MRRSLLALVVLSAGCFGSPPTEPWRPPSFSTAMPVVTHEEPLKPIAPPENHTPRWENPGGMWMPSQMPAHAAKLKELGLQIDPAELADPTSKTLSAIVWLQGCSASFVSPDGLIVSNHHCATGALQHNATPEHNLVKDGYLAKTRADEKNNGPQARVYVTRAVTDVTDKVRKDLEKIADDRAREKEIEKRQKDIVAACEKGKKELRCTVSSFYEGASFYLIEQLEIRDVRLVWAPPLGVGNFGGEIDNWRWPRHTGDVSMFRAYVGKDGMPADYSADNVPYKPKSWIKIAREPLRENDLVFIAGYPGRTSSLKTKHEVDEAVTWWYPRRQKMLEDYLARLEELTKDDKEAQIRGTSYFRRFANTLTNTKGQLDGLVKGGLAEDKAKKEKALRAFIDADADRKAKWGAALDEIAQEEEKNAAHREADAELREELMFPKLMSAASLIVRLAEERQKPDAERDPDYQERNWKRHEQALAAMKTTFHPKIDKGFVVLAVERALKVPEKERSAAIAMITKATTKGGIEKDVAALYAGSKLDDEKTRLELLTKATPAQLAASKDTLIQLAVKMRPLLKEYEERTDRLTGKMALLKPKYIEALKAFHPEPIAPDANSTLRITYGTVRGYNQYKRPFTTISEMAAKATGKPPFDPPARVLDAIKEKKFGPYVDSVLHEVPVDFLSDLHITGGNSGSATLNAKGELVGLAFDGNYEAMASDWVFVPSITRTIQVDFRYIEWLLDATEGEGGDAILKELGLTPAIP
jgi:hypothetical protein